MFFSSKKKKLLAFILNEYDKNINTYQTVLSWALNSKNSQEYDLAEINHIATQTYYEEVFNSVCNKLSETNFKFKSIYPLKLLTTDIDPKQLNTYDILMFTYECLYNKKINAALCVFLNHYVNDKKNEALAILDEYLSKDVDEQK